MNAKIAVLTASGDPGHMMIRQGVLNVLQSLGHGTGVEIIDKHLAWHSSDAALREKLIDPDVLILAPGPLVWPAVRKSDWAVALRDALEVRAQQGKAAVAVALGSCLPLQDDNSWSIDSLSQPDLEYAQEILGYMASVSVRDEAMLAVADAVGVSAQLLPCIATLAFQQNPHVAEAEEKGLLLNFMHAGGHHDYDNIVDARRWEEEIRRLIQQMEGHRPLSFVCHSPVEYELAALLSESAPRWRIRGPEDLSQASVGSAAAIVNRVHAAVGLRALGKNVVVAGSDTRILTAKPLGANCVHVNSFDASQTGEWLQQGGSQPVRESCHTDYTDQLSPVIPVADEF